ncbi:ABC transporter permease [Fulvivirgaceae bacterium PWU4]|uniref:ABC transporter permease n=1 Tax=Chryseosolibacter histidini TaxID=2782349 RepID=A0AAP2DM95_9BACT|nr:ABC transporter permease [Chryseosolibacter histidini]MBT1697873.1 ABC transporter permease [Chryseosolibacter histidini]
MIKNYLTSVFRYISRNKAFTAINISGLAIGMMACMLITQFVLHEFSYDDYHEKKDRIFRVQLDRYNKGEIETRWAAGCLGIGPDLKANFPEVEKIVRMYKRNTVMSYGDVFFKEEGVYYASEDFFEVFTVPLIEGRDSSALRGPNKAVLSRSMAKKYFGAENPVGKTIRDNGRREYEVTGIFEDLPTNTHMKVDALFSFDTWIANQNPQGLTSWQWDGFFTYLLLTENADAKALEAKLPAYVEKREGENLKQWNAGMVFHLQPLTDIHLDSDFMGEFKPNGDRRSAYFLSIVAVLILVIAWINYINLSTAKSIERAREVGVRKVMGSFRTQLVQQFLFESLLLNTVAVFVAIAFVVMLTPWFSELTGRELGYLLFKQKMFWVWMGLLIAGGALLSGLYPAFVLSGYKPVEVLKGRFKNTGQGVLFRKGMVVTQFVASITLIVGTFTVYRQIRYMQEQALGVNLDQTLVVYSPNVVDSTYQKKFLILKEKIKQYPEVANMTASSAIPGAQPGWNAGGIRRLSQREDEANQYRVIMMDHDFVPLFGLNVLAGRGFSDEPNEYKNVLLNEAACRQMGFEKAEDAINDEIFFWGDTFRIVGVLKNYHQESLKKSHEPLVFRYSSSPGGYYSIRFNTANVKESMSRFEEQWKALFPGNPFISFFLDDHYNKQYQADQQFGKVFGIFSTIAIFIACLGLFGLSSLTAIQRTKEIGVRKVLGASITSILTLISRDYLVLMLAAITVAVPLAWWVMSAWLEAFANRIPLSWWIFAIPSLLVITIALLTVSVHTLKAARTNPTKSLRYE